MKRRLSKRILSRALSALLALAALIPLPGVPALAEEPGAGPPFAVVDVRASTTPVKPGGTFDAYVIVHFDLDVMGITHADYNDLDDKDKAVLTVSGFSYTGLYLYDPYSPLTQTIGEIDKDGWARITLRVSLSSTYNSSSVSLTAEVSYSDGDTDYDTGKVSRPIPVDTSKPDPIIIPDPAPPPDPTAASISVVPATVTLNAGQSARFTFEVVNSGERAANNLKATLTPVGSEMQRLLDANPPASFTATVAAVRRNSSANNGNRGAFTYNLTVPNTVKSGVYELRITGSYYHETSNNLGTFEGSVQVVVINDFEPVSMQITDVGPLYPVKPGELFNVNIQVMNSGGLPARDAVLSIRNLSENSFSMLGSATAGFIGQVGAGQSGNRTLTLRAAQKMEPGVWPVIVSLSYIDTDDRPQTTDYETFIEVLGSPEPLPTEIEMIRATVPGGILKPGQRTVLTIELRNPSGAAAENVRIRVSGFSGTGLYLADEENNLPSKVIESVPPGERAIVMYNVILSDMCSMPALALQAEISYKSGEGETGSLLENINIPVLLPPPEEPSPPPDTTSSTPKLILDRYAMSWEDVPVQTLRAGAMFDLTFTLRNTSLLTDLSNITVTLLSADGVFMPAAGSNTFYIDGIEAGGETERTIRLVVAQNAETKSYQLNFSLDYEDKDGMTYRPGETLSLPVVVPLIVELSNFNPPMWGEMGMQTYMMFNYINKGKGTVYNFTIDIEGDFMIPDGSSYYIGNLVSGYIDWFECMLIPMTSGEVSGAVVLSFEDAVGNVTEMREEFIINVNEPFYPEFPMDGFPGIDPWNPEPEQGGGLFGMPLWLTIACGAGVAVIALVTILLVRRGKIKKRRAREEEDYESENEAE